MSITSGFYNSLNGDRKYNAEQMSAIFDGIINDGILANVGDTFTVRASIGTTVTIAAGRAWFNSTWVYNDALYPLTLTNSELLLDRIDAIVIEINRDDNIRKSDIKAVKGVPSSNPVYPELTNEGVIHQYPLAYIYRSAGSTEITQADITSMIGKSVCPYVTGILQVQNIDNIVAQWEAEFDEWTAAEKSDFMTWFRELETVLAGDVATALAEHVIELQNKFDQLTTTRSLNESIEDSNGDSLKDSDGGVIDGSIVFGDATQADLIKMEKRINELSIKVTNALITTDAATGKRYRIGVYDGSMFMEEI